MKFLAVVVVLIAQGAYSEQTPRIGLDETINKTLECVRNLLNTGDEELGLPSFNPLIISNLDIDLDLLGLENVNGQLTINDVIVAGITDWITTHLKAGVTILPAGAKIEITLVWPAGTLAGEYSGDINVLGHNLKGDGHVIGSLVNFGIEIELEATLIKISLKKLSVRPSVENIDFEISGLMIDGVESSEIINDIINGIPAWLAENVDEIDAKLSQLIMDIVNNSQGGGGEGGIIGGVLQKCLFKNMIQSNVV